MIYLILNLLSSLYLQSDSSLIQIDKFGNFQNASSISASREEFIFVTDIQSNQIYKFSSSGEKLQNFGGPGFGNNELNYPVSIDASNGLDVFVSDYHNNRIQRYDLKLNYIATFDFNIYNLTADASKKIYYPSGIVFLNTSEIFALADAGVYKVVKLKSLDEVSLFFGSNFGFDKLIKPKKIIKGTPLSLLILDKESDEVVLFDNYGSFIRRIENSNTSPIISIAFYYDNLYILYNQLLISYDLKKGQYLGRFTYEIIENETISDCTMLDQKYFLVLTNKQVFKFKFN
ncbi:MAG: hypothetical protein ACRDFC_06640 [Ignavibacteria bacterium]